MIPYIPFPSSYLYPGTIIKEIHQNYHRFVLLDAPNMGSLLAPDFWILQIFHKFPLYFRHQQLDPQKKLDPILMTPCRIHHHHPLKTASFFSTF